MEERLQNDKVEIKVEDNEINFIDLIKFLWVKKWFVVQVTIVFVIFALVFAFTTPKEYRTSCTLISEATPIDGRLGGSLGGLASLAGVELGNIAGTSSTINPGLYESIARSTPFLTKLMNQTYYFANINDSTTVFNYFREHKKTTLISKVIGLSSRMSGLLFGGSSEIGLIDDLDNNLILLTADQKAVYDELVDRILVTMDWELRTVTIDVEMQDPFVAAQVANFTMKYLTEYAIAYSIAKSQAQLLFVKEQFLERKTEFEAIQNELATFRDKNINVNTAKARSEEQRLESEYNLAYNIYNQLAEQKEKIKLMMNEQTPVFTVLEPPQVPLKRSRPKRALILVSFFLIGVVCSVMYIVLKLNFSLDGLSKT